MRTTTLANTLAQVHRRCAAGYTVRTVVVYIGGIVFCVLTALVMTTLYLMSLVTVAVPAHDISPRAVLMTVHIRNHSISF